MGDPLESNRSDALRIDDRQYRLFVESVTDYAIYLLDPQGLITTWNAGAQRFKGYDASEVIGRNFSMFYTPEDRANGAPKRSLHIASSEGRFETEGWRVRKDGSRFWASVVLDPIREQGQIVGYAKVTRDISDRKASIDALRGALAANQAIFDSSVDVICTIDGQGLFTKVSKSAVNVWGYEAEELVGQSFINFVHPDDREATLTTDRQIVMGGRPTYAFRNRYIHKNGAVVPIAWSAVWSEEQQAVICIARDMTESLAAEEKLRQSQKMEAVGRLTGGIAHDFNNLLTIILGGSEALLQENPDNSAVRELAEMIRSAGERGSELTSQLLAFARRQPLEPRSVHVNDLLVDMEGLLRRTLGEDVELSVAQDEHAWRTTVDKVQLELAVLNLAINARDAMPSGGKLTIETANVTLDEAYCKANDDIAVGEYLMIALTDDGEGMSPETVSQAFEPFFTTKPTGKGTGLGLSMVHGFVKQSKGSIKIYSELGVGTTLKLYLPRSQEDEACEDETADDLGLPHGEEHILLVEDDDLLREHASKQLLSLGYRVSVAASGPEALALIETLGDFDLLFTDVVMPDGLNGRQLADKVRTLRPDVKVLYTSGYAENAIVHHGRLDPGVDLMIKPYRKRELALKVRKVLNA
jgi:PAS domain S-box-containing protein